MTTLTLDLPVEIYEAPKCAHHWILGSDSAPETVGVCRRCGEQKTFQNHLPGDRYAKEWREARTYGTVLDKRGLGVAIPSRDDDGGSVYDQ